MLDMSGRSPLSEAITAQSLKIVTILVGNGANMNILDADGCSPFHKAVKSDDTKILIYFAHNGAEFKTKDIDDNDALEVAMNTKKQDACKILLYQQTNMF